MARDLRDFFQGDSQGRAPELPEGHEERFLERLEKAFPERRRSYRPRLLAIAASLVLLLGLLLYGYYRGTDIEVPEAVVLENAKKGTANPDFSLGNLSPDLRRIENYYVAQINLELADIEVSAENKALVDSFMERLSDLNMEYERLNVELGEVGPNDQTITALIKNLQLRLQLLYKLKAKMNDLKSSKNETDPSNVI